MRPPSPLTWWQTPTLLIGIWLLAWLWLQPPSPSPLDAPASDASAGRALATLDRLLDGVGPHPVGTPANAVVRSRIIDELRHLGIAAQVQQRVVCVPRGCADVHNIVGLIEGTDPLRDLVVLSAHYDSVPAGPGYSDDGAGVAAVLELGRLLANTPLQSGVLLLFTDGEEIGLAGAHAFTESAWAPRVGAVVNLEARGTSGSSFLFEIAGPSAKVAAAYSPMATSPSVSSLYVSIYRQLPNGTDVTAYKAMGWSASNLGFLGDAQLYHTPLDDRAHLSAGSVQHHLDQALGLVRGLSAADATDLDDNEVIFDVFGLWIVHYPIWLPTPLAAGLSLVLLGLTAAACWRRRMSIRSLSLALLLLIGLMATLAGAGWIIDATVRGAGWHGVPWIAHTGLWLLASAALMAAGPAVERLGMGPVIAASGLCFAALHGVAALALPEGSYVFLPGTLASLAALLAWLRVPPRYGQLIPPIVAVGALPIVHLALGLTIALGLSALILLATIGPALIALLPSVRRGSWFPAATAGVGAIALLALSTAMPSATERHPHGLQLDHVQVDNEAWVYAWNASFPRGGPLPAGWDLPVASSGGPLRLSRRSSTSITASGTDPSVVRADTTPTTTQLKIWAPGTHRTVILLPKGTLRTMINGVAGPTNGRLTWHGQADGLRVLVQHPGGPSITVFSASSGLPDELPMLPQHYVPIHDGWTSWRGVHTHHSR
ncbi:MAG: hypothetical protein ACI9MC_000164 [Kiritimatiellia bacterium]|jgi:hypothetical protein